MNKSLLCGSATLLFIGCTGGNPPASEPGNLLWAPVRTTELQRGLSSIEESGQAFTYYGSSILIDETEVFKTFGETESVCPDSVHFGKLPTDGALASESKFWLLETTSKLPTSAFGSGSTTVTADQIEDKYFLKIEENPLEEGKYVAKILVPPSNFSFETKWEQGKDPRTGSEYAGVATRISASLPATPLPSYVKKVAAEVDPCGTGDQ